MPTKRTVKIAFGIAALFIGLAATIVVLLFMGVLRPPLALLMLVALLGLYVGFGILILVYRLIRKLE